VSNLGPHQRLSNFIAARFGSFGRGVPGGVLGLTYGLYKLVDLRRFRRVAARWVIPGSVAIDIGAHVGYTSDALLPLVGSSGKVIAIEPQRSIVNSLRLRIESSGNRAATLIIEAAAHENDGWGSLEVAGAFGTDTRLIAEAGQTKLLKLDSLFSEFQGRSVSFVKLDAQGAEISVLRGATNLLKVHRPTLFVELLGDNLANGACDWRVLYGYLSDRGYVSIRPDRCQRKLFDSRSIAKRLRYREFTDGLFVHESHLAK